MSIETIAVDREIADFLDSFDERLSNEQLAAVRSSDPGARELTRSISAKRNVLYERLKSFEAARTADGKAEAAMRSEKLSP